MQKVIIDAPSLSSPQNIVNGGLASALIVKAYKNGMFIHKNATNGDIIQALFPNIDKGFSNVIDLNLWWNAKYKAESEEYPEKSGEMNKNVEEVLQTLEKLYNDFTMRPDECKALDFAINFIKENK